MKQKTMKGATSMIVIIFFALRAGILVLSFASIMITNMRETTNYSLSQSALDAANAGVEDAKVLLLEYNRCLNGSSATICSNIISRMTADDAEEDCDLVRNALGRDGGESGENSGRETKVSTQTTGNDTLDLAYTCVKLTVDTDDYLGTLDNYSGFRIVPLRRKANNVGDKVSYVRVSWFNEGDRAKAEAVGLQSISASASDFSDNKTKITDNSFNKYTKEAVAPSTLDVGLIQAASGFKLTDFYLGSASGTDRGFLSFRPRTDGSGTNYILGDDAFISSVNNGTILENGQPQENYLNSPVDIRCDDHLSTDYMCSVMVKIPEKTRTGAEVNNNMRYLTLSLPYSTPDTSFKVEMFDENQVKVKFAGVQSKVDATGRANNVFRRIESRVEAVDNTYPFPKYSIGLSDDNAGIDKAFEVTINRWCRNGNNYVDSTSGTCPSYKSGDNGNNFN